MYMSLIDWITRADNVYSSPSAAMAATTHLAAHPREPPLHLPPLHLPPLHLPPLHLPLHPPLRRVATTTATTTRRARVRRATMQAKAQARLARVRQVLLRLARVRLVALQLPKAGPPRRVPLLPRVARRTAVSYASTKLGSSVFVDTSL
ncbi:hypothetical protein NEOLEDRAFT_1120089 [Neolentinus lepideus HHB14362 ss-1]|uniref:Uncharacterized protein n=1 Tax=Neolentinus lepideus HHB14362 ss-1 TaxID=1314782 RepID=A0A165Q8T9_9AGAM|nr:hypothetical protein NEOLEDRAFT_1120089 [Neolentinus lepideus HHB14362 ss-1]